jgi:hypothetical protein
VFVLLGLALVPAGAQQPKPAAVKVGAAAAELEADDDMVIGQ